MPESLDNTDVFVVATIQNMPIIHDNHIRFNALIERFELHGESQEIELPVRLSWYQYQTVVKPGDQWRFHVRLKRPWSLMNPNGFDFSRWLFLNDIVAQGYVRRHGGNQLIKHQPYRYPIEYLRNEIAGHIRDTSGAIKGLALALTLGERNELEDKYRHVLRATGTNHLLAISGLHLSLIAGLFYFIAHFLWSRFYYGTQILAAPIFASIIAVTMALFYAALAGFSLPTQRALIMLSCVFFSLFCGKRLLVSQVVGFAVLLILIYDPWAILATSFWLSFLAVSIILYSNVYRSKMKSKIAAGARLQCCLSIGLAPFVIFYFNQLPVYSIPANIFAVPITGFIIMPLLLLAVPMLFLSSEIASFIYQLVTWVADLQWHYLHYLSMHEHSLLYFATPSKMTLVFAILGIIILMVPKGLPRRWLGLFSLLPLCFPLLPRPQEGEFNFTLLDVGQGLATVITTAKHTLIYDTGARFSKRFDMGEVVLTPFLRGKGVEDISLLLLSHGDNDHIGGSAAILKNFSVQQVMSSSEKLAHQVDIQPCYAGINWEWDGVRFEILHPAKNTTFLSSNNQSCVMRIISPHGSVLFTGDIERQAEKNLLKHSKEQLAADILIVPHHGSKSSSTKQFIAAVDPKIALFSLGYNNKFGHPDEHVVQRYHHQGVQTHISHETGAIEFNINYHGIKQSVFRENNSYFWHYNIRQ